MKFSEKLDLLMSITNTKNSILARAISLDPSYISRLRSGARVPAKNENYIERLASYFAKNVISIYQQTALCEVLDMELSAFPDTQKQLYQLISEWFHRERMNSEKAVEQFLTINSESIKQKKQLGVPKNYELTDDDAIYTTILYGNSGRQTMVNTILKQLSNNENNDTLYFVNEDNISWLIEDSAYRKSFYSLLSHNLTSGNKIKAILTLNRTLDELYVLIEIWISLYLSGNCELYYYPYVRDNLVKNTMFIAPKTVGFYSFCYNTDTVSSANMMITDNKMLTHLVTEFNQYLSRCVPFIKTFTQTSKERQYDLLLDFETREGDCIFISNMFSTLTLPDDTLFNIISRSTHRNSATILDYYNIKKQIFISNLENYKFIDVITLPSIEDINSNKVRVNIHPSFEVEKVYYTKIEFINHMKTLICFLKEYENYHIRIMPKVFFPNCIICAKRNVGALISKNDLPDNFSAINEIVMSNIMWDFLCYKANISDISNLDKTGTIRHLQQFVKTCEES